MSVSFNSIPVNLLTPGQYVEIDNSRAVSGLAGLKARILLIAPMLSTGTASPNVPFQLGSLADAKRALGIGSAGAAMVASELKVTDTVETFILPIQDPESGVSATGTITVTGTPSQAGTISLYIAGKRVQVAATVTMSATEIAEAIKTAINDDLELPVTANSSSGTVTVSSRHKGVIGNDISMMVNYYASERTPDGLTIQVTAKLTGGSGNPTITTALSNIGSAQYNTMICGFNDEATLKAITDELDVRWGPLYQNDGHCHAAIRGTVGTINNLMNNLNNPHLSVWACEEAEPQPIWEKAALCGTIAAYYFEIDPARPLQTLVVPGRMPAPLDKRFTRAERNNLLSYGAATTKATDGGDVVIERAVTTYKKNSDGVVDPSYRDAETMYTLSLLRYQVRARISMRFPRFKLAKDGTQFPAGQAVVTPRIIRAELISLFQDWIEAALVEDLDQFKKDLIVEINNSDPNRVDCLLPPNVVNQFRVFAANLSYRL